MKPLKTEIRRSPVRRRRRRRTLSERDRNSLALIAEDIDRNSNLPRVSQILLPVFIQGVADFGSPFDKTGLQLIFTSV